MLGQSCNKGRRHSLYPQQDPLLLHILLMPSSSQHLIWSKGQTRCTRTSSKGDQGRVINHKFTTDLHSLLSHTIILPSSTHIPPSFNNHFTPSIYTLCSLPLNLTPLIVDPTIVSINQSSFILFMYLIELNTHCSAWLVNSFITPVLLRASLSLTQSYHICYSTPTPQTPNLHHI